MKVRYLFLIVGLLFVTTEARARDWGYSHNFFIKKELNDKWDFVSRSLFTSRDSMRDIFFGVADVGLRYNVNDVLSFDGVYRGAWFGTDSWDYENRPLVNINLTKSVKGFYLSNRNRFEFRIFTNKPDDIRYRNETRIVFPLELTKFKFKPYIEEEYFYSFNSKEVNMNWATTGLMYQVNKNTRVKMGYRWFTQKLAGNWTHRHVLVTGVFYQF